MSKKHRADSVDRVIDYRQAAWGIRPESLTAIVNAIRLGQLKPVEPDAFEMVPAAQDSEGVTTTGGIAVLSLTGVIRPSGGGSILDLILGLSGGGLKSFRTQFREALADDEVSSILINVDSPGGLIDLVPETAAEIREARGEKPIVAISNTMAASAAYWIASQADELVVTPSGEVGSIGVIAIHDEFSKMDEKMGITTTIMRQPPAKGEGNPFEPLTEEAQANIQGRIDALYDFFTGDVAKGRGTTDKDVKANFGQGRMVPPAEALKAGMVDAVETIEQTVDRLIGTPRGAKGGAIGASAASVLDPKAVAAEIAKQLRAEVDNVGGEEEEVEPPVADEPPAEPSDDEPPAEDAPPDPDNEPDDSSEETEQQSARADEFDVLTHLS